MYVSHRFLISPGDPAVPGGYYRLYSAVDAVTFLRPNRRVTDRPRFFH